MLKHAEIGLMGRPFHNLLADAHNVHRQRYDPHIVEGAMLLWIKTGLPGRLRLLPAAGEVAERRGAAQADGCRGDRHSRAEGEGVGDYPVLPRRGVAVALNPLGAC